MAWDFDGVNQYVRFTMNATLQAAPGGPMAMACVIYFDSTTDGAVIHMLTSAQASRPWIEMFANWNYGTTAGARSGPAGVTGAWYLAIFSKQTGNVAPEYTLIPLATGTPVSGTLTGGGVTLGDGTATGAGGIIQVARWGTSASEYIDGRIAATAIWNVYLNQTQREALTTWALWLASSGLQWAVHFDTLSTLTDASGLGGGETGRFGTASITLAADPGALAVDFFAAGGSTPVTITDTSGGSSASGSDGRLTVDQIKTDTSGGSGAAGSDGALSVGVTITDASGGASAAWSDGSLVVDQVRVDTSGGAGAGGSTDRLTVDQIKTDTSGGSSASGSGDQLAVGVTKTDTSGGSGAAGALDVLLAGRTITDTSGGSGAAGSLDAFAASVTLTDASGGASAAGSADGTASAVTITDTSGGAAGAGTANPLTVGIVITDGSGGSAGAGSADSTPHAVTITDTSGGAAGASSSTPSASPIVKRDTMVMPLLTQALACLRTEASFTKSPPASYHIRPGLDFENQADRYGDECCDGIGWTRMVVNYEGSDEDWVEPAGRSENCAPSFWAVVIEVGIMRCVPMASNRHGDRVTDEQWTAAAQAQADDGAALRRVLCCLRDIYSTADVVSGQITPLPLTGGCGGSSLQITLRAPACDC